MGYKGRIWSQVFVFTFFGTWFLLDVLDESKNLHDVLLRLSVYVVSAVVAWLFGLAYDRLARDAKYDVITGVCNRRFAMESIPRILRKANARGECCSFFILDGNGLKRLNDTFGHAYGDAIIREIAATLRRILPSDGMVTRLGGDEFLCVLPRMESPQAATLVRMLESSIADSSRENKRWVTVSAGYAVFPDDGIELNTLLEVADGRMYARKQESYQNRIDKAIT